MGWKKVDDNNAVPVRDFLLEREEYCAGAVSRFKDLVADGLDTTKRGTVHAEYSDGETGIVSFLLYMEPGIVFIILDNPSDARHGRSLKSILKGKKVSSVQGLVQDVMVVEQVLARLSPLFSRKQKLDPVDYTLMELKGLPSEKALVSGPPGMELNWASPQDAGILFPLQAAYEIEEVIPKGEKPNMAAIRIAFEKTLKERITLYATIDGRVVGKAATNAQAYTRDQIGGVYVLHEYRSKGIATRLVAELAASLVSRGRKIVLFVKKENTPARKAYEKAGFLSGKDYRISYIL